MTEWLLVLAGVGLTIGTALFVATEFSLVALDRPTVQQAVDDGDARRRGRSSRSLRRLSTQLSAAQVGITLTTLSSASSRPRRSGRCSRRRCERARAVRAATRPVGGRRCSPWSSRRCSRWSFGELLPQFLGISAPAGHRQGRGRAGARASPSSPGR